MRIWLAWGFKNQLLSVTTKAAGPSQAAGLPSGPPSLAATEGIELATECWLAVGCQVINAYYGDHKDGTLRKPGKVHKAALAGLRSKIQRFLIGEVPSKLGFSDVIEEINTKRVSYTGEEISQPLALSMEQIEKGLPPAQHGGSVDAVEFVTGRTKYLLVSVFTYSGMGTGLKAGKGAYPEGGS